MTTEAGQRAWWLRWDGLPPGMERRVIERNERLAQVRGWRRHLVSGWFGPFALAVAQVVGLADAEGWQVVWRLTVLVLCVGLLAGSIAARRSLP